MGGGELAEEQGKMFSTVTGVQRTWQTPASKLRSGACKRWFSKELCDSEVTTTAAQATPASGLPGTL